MDRAEIKEGKERVRRCLIEPLEDDGMTRRKATVAEHDAFLAKVESACCYMGEETLDTLRLAVSTMAVECKSCRRKEGWPSLQAIRSQAHRIQAPPVTMSPMITSYMRSKAGHWALSQGNAYAVALVKFMRTRGYPPTKDNDGWSVISRDAAEFAREASRREEWIENEIAHPKDIDTQKAYEAAIARARKLVLGDADIQAEGEAA